MLKDLSKGADRGAARKARFWEKLAFHARFLKSDITGSSVRLASARQRVLVQDFLHRHGPKEDEMAVVCYGQIGDTYMLARYAAAAKEQHALKRIIFYTRVRQTFIPRLFAGVDEAVAIPDNVPVNLLFDGWTGGSIESHPRIVGQSAALMRAMGYSGLTHDDITRISLGLGEVAKPEAAQRPSTRELDLARNLLQELKLEPKRTAFLIPGAVSTAGRSECSIDWKSLCGLLGECGWKVVANEGPEGPLIEGVPSVRLPLESLRPLAEAAGLVVSNRCGLTDLLSDLPVAHIAFYPSIRWCLGQLIELHGLKANGLAVNCLDIELGMGGAEMAHAIRAFLMGNAETRKI